jgi:polysaccharide export outer membrane protein
VLRSFRVHVVALLILTSGYGWAQRASDEKQSHDDAQGPSFQERYPRYRLHVGDVLELNFPFTPEFDQTVTVQPDGHINLRSVGDLRVQNASTPEMVEMVRKAYSNILHDPAITVKLKEFEKPYFVVGGEVAHPGKFDLRGDTTVIQAVTIAGGFSQKSKTSQVLLFRRVDDNFAEVKQVDLKHMLKAGDLSEDLHLRSGDMVLVPKTTFSKIAPFIPIPTLGTYFHQLPY